MVLKKTQPRILWYALIFAVVIFSIAGGITYFLFFDPGRHLGFETDTHQYRRIAGKSALTASHASRGEIHLFLYLLYHSEIDRKKVEARIKALAKSVNELSTMIGESPLRDLAGPLKAWIDKAPDVVTELFETHDGLRPGDPPLDFIAHRQEILTAYGVFSNIRKLATRLNEKALDLENQVQQNAKHMAMKERRRFYTYLGLVLGVVLVLGGVWIRSFFLLAREVRQRKIAEAAGTAQEEKYKTLFTNMRVGVFYQQADGRLSDANQAALEMFGMTRDQFVGRTSKHPDWRVIREDGSEFPGPEHPSMQALATGQIIQDVVAGIWSPEGQAFNWISITAVPQFRQDEKNPWQVFVTMLDISPRKRIEQALKFSEATLKMLNDQTEQLSLAAAGLISMEDRKDLFQTISNAIVDYTDYQRVIISLFKDEFPFREIVGFAGISKAQVDRLRGVEFKKSWYDGVFEKGITIGQFSYYIPHTMKHILNQEATYYGEGQVPDKDGVWHPEDNLFVRLNDEKGRFIGVISVDDSKSGQIPSALTIRPLEIFSILISQIIILKHEQKMRKKAEAHLRQGMKMESIGTLAGGIAHDFNNILGIILGNAELSMDEFAADHPGYESLLEIKDASLRGADIVRQLLNYSSEAEHSLETIDIIPVIHDTLSFMRSSLPATVEMDFRITPQTAVVMADPIQINRVLMNLCINAFQSMPDEKGRIDVSAKIIQVSPADRESLKGLGPGAYLRIVVSDTGAGIAPEIRDRIFDPYFTTKDVGKGSGMGLAVVAGIVKVHEGVIWVDSTPGRGSRFFICLPLASSTPGQLPDKETRGSESGQVRILFVDDDPAISAMYQKLLTRMGYEVRAVNDPFQALDLFKADPDQFDLVITDMTMPGMTGADLAGAIMGYEKDFPVIICTGHSDLIDEVSATDQGIAAFVTKPIVSEKMGETIRRVLDRPGMAR